MYTDYLLDGVQPRCVIRSVCNYNVLRMQCMKFETSSYNYDTQNCTKQYCMKSTSDSTS